MTDKRYERRVHLRHILAGAALAAATVPALAAGGGAGSACVGLPDHAQLKSALEVVVASGDNAGLANEMWATVVNRDGIVCAVAFSGADRGDQWPGSRVISAQKANTANAFSLPGNAGFGGALSSANLFNAVQPGGSLFGLQHSNPVDTGVAYGGNAKHYGQPNDPMVGKRIGGVNVFGGGLALYASANDLRGGLGVSGNTSCADHIIAWKVRDALDLDSVPGGVSASGDDNIIFDPTNAFGHPTCLFPTDEVDTAAALPGDFPIE